MIEIVVSAGLAEYDAYIVTVRLRNRASSGFGPAEARLTIS